MHQTVTLFVLSLLPGLIAQSLPPPGNEEHVHDELILEGKILWRRLLPNEKKPQGMIRAIQMPNAVEPVLQHIIWTNYRKQYLKKFNAIIHEMQQKITGAATRHAIEQWLAWLNRIVFAAPRAKQGRRYQFILQLTPTRDGQLRCAFFQASFNIEKGRLVIDGPSRFLEGCFLPAPAARRISSWFRESFQVPRKPDE
ncbi:MAG: hypothetical protein D6820_18585 [Lentisphaerae bacterium]|nr:MAG: hypothetical protein D6820_18585 [Lentisphaerota bacterium]